MGVDITTTNGKTTARNNLGITLENLNAVPTTRTINGKALSSDFSLNAADVGALTISGISGGASSIITSNLTTSRALISNSSGKVAASAVTSTELGYLTGVSSAIQTQLNGKVPTSRTVNSKNLSSNITLTASDVGALSNFSLLVSGQTLNTSNTSFTITNADNYKAFILFAYTTGSSASASQLGYASIIIPKSMISTSKNQFVVTDGINSKIFSMRFSGTSLLVENVGYQGGGVSEKTVSVYGLL